MYRMSRLPVIAALLCLTASGCATTTGGTAAPAAPVPPTPTKALPALLLSASEVGAAMGAGDLTVTREVSAPWNDSAHFQGAGREGCLAIAGAAQQGVYAGTGWTAMTGQVLREPPTAPAWDHFATQAVVLFPSAEAAADFYARSRAAWAGCSDREMRYSQMLGPDQVWMVGPVSTDRDMLTVSRSQRSPQQWFCQRALRVRGDVAIDVEACDATGGTTAAADIAAAIGGRLPAA